MLEGEVINYFVSRFPFELKGLTIGLVGDLGAGKTHLVRNVLSGCAAGYDDQVSSPTYNLCNNYNDDELNVNHFDLYRIEAEEELYDIGLWESIGNQKDLTLIEWVDLYPEAQQRCDVIIKIKIVSDDRRQYKLIEN